MTDDRAEIQDLNSRYAIAFDSRCLDEAVDCWAEDGILDETGTGFGLFEGHAAIRAYFGKLMDGFPHVIHVMFNHLTTGIDGDHGAGSVHCLVEFVSTDGSYDRVHVKYDDRYVRVGGGWKFASRVLTPTFPRGAHAS
ncbi:hypothetical protein A6A06_22330 [Streptomyces sp. CB02923]|uniref:nuclear transport factor 2 family protein n=1 Tax=Streptomyces sp. CB02923 TaxID=1718985 RepID=UPI00093F5855|nr:nuclear transport factor 2 family protein [Streptomyces sp. CB02923]OKH99810.1 hypothetical protein A6A06_22330 [Streptomyces sp. CB02923]